MITQSWNGKISNHAQLGGIETSVLDAGTAKGTRIAWINTGTGLRYKVVLDRAMDIAEAFYNGHSLAWISQAGVKPPQPALSSGIEWLHGFGGGLLVTCGLDHIGGPESDEHGNRGLHGPVSNIAAEIESIIQPDPAAGRLEMSITGVIRQFRIFGPNLEMRRTISGKLGEPFIQIRDEVINRGNTVAPHMLLYHCNLGWPLVDEGTKIVWDGSWQSRDGKSDNAIFNADNNFRRCPSPLDAHAGSGEEAAFIDIVADADDNCLCGLYNAGLQLALSLTFKKSQLPWLTNWQHWGNGEYVTGLEPGTNPPVGQAKARADGRLIQLEPGESRTYELRFDILYNDDLINTFLKNSTKAY